MASPINRSHDSPPTAGPSQLHHSAGNGLLDFGDNRVPDRPLAGRTGHRRVIPCARGRVQAVHSGRPFPHPRRSGRSRRQGQRAFHRPPCRKRLNCGRVGPWPCFIGRAMAVGLWRSGGRNVLGHSATLQADRTGPRGRCCDGRFSADAGSMSVRHRIDPGSAIDRRPRHQDLHSERIRTPPRPDCGAGGSRGGCLRPWRRPGPNPRHSPRPWGGSVAARHADPSHVPSRAP
ncbi:MAG: hypothetical protein RL216_3386 [Pseudomonadota bacterium]